MDSCYCSSYHYGMEDDIFGVGIGWCLIGMGWVIDRGIRSRFGWGASFVGLGCGNGVGVGVGARVVNLIIVRQA